MSDEHEKTKTVGERLSALEGLVLELREVVDRLEAAWETARTEQEARCPKCGGKGYYGAVLKHESGQLAYRKEICDKCGGVAELPKEDIPEKDQLEEQLRRRALSLSEIGLNDRVWRRLGSLGYATVAHLVDLLDSHTEDLAALPACVRANMTHITSCLADIGYSFDRVASA